MNKLIKISFAALAGASLFCGCIKETFPNSGATTEQVENSVHGFQSMINGLQQQLMAVGSAGAYSAGFHWDFGLPSVHIVFDSMCEDLAITGNPGYDWFGAWGCNQYLGDMYYQCIIGWDNYYPWIKTCNEILNATPAESTAASAIRTRGMAKTFRAMFYLDLVRMYEFKENSYTTAAPGAIGVGVPIVTEETTEADARNNPRARLEDCYAFILSDLKYAEEAFEGYSRENKTQPDLSVVYGLYARTYLAMAAADEQYYALAADYARRAINVSGCQPLTQSEWEDPANGFNSMSSNDAWMWGLTLPAENVSNLLCFTAHMSNEAGWTSYGQGVGRAISTRLYRQIPDTDFRKHSWFDPQGFAYYDYQSARSDKQTFFPDLGPLVSLKFRPAQGNYQTYKVGGAADHPLMRVEEMYLIEAEAVGHANVTSGLRLLNDFMNSYRDPSYNGTSKVTDFRSLQVEVMLQKRIEFWGEGICFFDFKRLRLGCTRGYAGTNITGDYLLNADEIAPWWNWVIPRGETQNNQALVNNPDPMGTVEPWGN